MIWKKTSLAFFQLVKLYVFKNKMLKTTKLKIKIKMIIKKKKMNDIFYNLFFNKIIIFYKYK